MLYVLTHYQGDWQWVKKYTDNYLIYDRSGGPDFPQRVERENIGDADYDRLSYLVDHYDSLPEVFLLAKSNLWKYCPEPEFQAFKDRREYTPLLTKHHKTYEPVCRYNEEGMYEEINNSWYLNSHPSRYFASYGDFAAAFGLPNPEYLEFAPGGNYILARERVQRYPVEFYKALRDLLPWSVRPGEAQMIERTYHHLWR